MLLGFYVPKYQKYKVHNTYLYMYTVEQGLIDCWIQ